MDGEGEGKRVEIGQWWSRAQPGLCWCGTWVWPSTPTCCTFPLTSSPPEKPEITSSCRDKKGEGILGFGSADNAEASANSQENAGGKIGKVEVREVGVENSLAERIEEAQNKAQTPVRE